MRLLPKAILTIAALIFGNELLAMPEFSVRSNQNCQLCHVNPSGGGMRALYGAQVFSYMDLPVKELDDFARLDSINPTLGRHFQFGVDFRSLYYSSDDTLSGNSFVTMEGTFYATIAPTDHTKVYFSRSLHSSGEAFALIEDLPFSSAFRAGRFMPAYGWRFVDHNSYVRSRLGFGQGRGLEDGVEYGFYALEGDLSASLSNGSPGITDRDRGKAVTLRASRRQSIGGWNLTGGLSWRYAEFQAGKGFTEPPLRRFGGPFWGINIGSITCLGEAAWIVSDRKELAITHSLGYQIKRGLHLVGQYDFHDPDLDVKTGYDWRIRAGADIFPTGYLELAPGFVWERLNGREHGTGEIQLHVWF